MTLKPEPMVKCRIVATKTQSSIIINTLYDLGLYHITPHLKGEDDLDIGEPLADAEELSEALIKIRKVLEKYPKKRASSIKPLDKKTWDSAKNKVETVHAKLASLEARFKEISELKERSKVKTDALSTIKEFNVDFAALKESQSLTSFFGTLSKTEGIEQALSKLTPTMNISRREDQVLVVGKKSDEQAIAGLLGEFGFSETKIELHSKTIVSEISNEKKQKEKLSKEGKKLQDELKTIQKEIINFATLEVQIREEIKKQELPLNFAVTGSSFVAQGWIPRKDSRNVMDALSKATNNAVHIEITNPKKKEEPPVKLAHKMLVSPFEFLVRLFDLPKYKEFDPTILIFLTFPFFYGFMLGDVGYGLVLLAGFYLLKKKVPAAKDLANILMFAAVVSVLFGFVYGEAFGFEHLSRETGSALCDKVGICLEKVIHESHGHKTIIYEFPRLLNRVHSQMNVFGYEVLTILVIGAIIGFLHLNFGFLLGFLNELKSHGFWHAVLAKMSWVILQAGLITAILSFMGFLLPVMMWVGFGISFLSIIMLGFGEGLQGIVEIPGLLSNVLSYMRLGAVGLASVGLAVVINEDLAIPFIQKGGIFIVVGILIMIIGHAINILLGVIGPFLHGIRLHYVEFFSKFFQGGGSEYNPFKKEEVSK